MSGWPVSIVSRASPRRQRRQLSNMRLLDAVDQDPFAAKGTELRDRSLSERS